MSRLFKRNPAVFAAIGLLTLAASAGCAVGSKAAATGPSASTEPTSTATAEPSPVPDAAPPAPTTTKAPPKQAAPSWPSPEDCISYNPANVTVVYEAGIYSVNDGSKVVMRLHGGPGENVGDQGLALAKRFRKHCFIGRNNTRTEERNSYIFDYWRDPSGNTPAIPDEEDACSDYDRTNLTVEDMGSGYGWRVKDHDHVLHVFDDETDARNGKLVLAKYRMICFIGHEADDGDQDVVSYMR